MNRLTSESDTTYAEKKSRTTFPFAQCIICNDKATGFHYGVESCEGCKGFFKRTTSKNEKFRCYFGNNCELNPENRSRCKACRYRRCLEVGMSLDAVKMGRIPKEKRRVVLENRLNHVDDNLNEENQISSIASIQTSKADENERNNEVVLFDEVTSSESISRSMLDNNFTFKILGDFLHGSFKSDLNQLQTQIERAQNLIQLGNTCQIECFNTKLIWTGLTDCIKDHVKSFINFTRSIPCFCDLDTNDYTHFVEQKIFDYCIVKNYKLLINNEFYIIFNNGIQYSFGNMLKLASAELVNGMLHMKNALNRFNLNDRELSVFMVFLLSDPRNLKLIKKKDAIVKYHELVGRVLAHELFANKRNKDFIKDLKNFLDNLHELRVLEQTSFRAKQRIEIG